MIICILFNFCINLIKEMNYKPISDSHSLDIVEDDGELDVVNIK